MKKIAAGAETQERLLLAIVLMIGTLLMLLAGQIALQIPRSWQIQDTNMDSKLNPNEVYAMYRTDYDFRLAPIRTDIPNLLATVPTGPMNLDGMVPPVAVAFRAPAQIATTTSFPFNSLTPITNPSSTVLATSSGTPTPSLTPSHTPLPSSTASRTPTRTATRTRMPTATSTRTNTPTASATPSVTLTLAPSSTVTYTRTPVNSATVTFTSTAVPTATFTATTTATNTATATYTQSSPLPNDCIITGSNNYTIPAEGCTASYETSALGAIISLAMIDSGNLSISWHGLLENQTSGICAARSANMTPATTLTNIAVAKTTGTTFIISNSNNKTITVQITISDWTEGGCQ